MSEITQGDATDLPFSDESFHAVVTDPPYGLAFMGKDWDDFEPKEYQEWCEEWATECLRILKPGGHMVAFSGSRTYGRLMCGVQDSGFEIRDTITWHYGSGFAAGKVQDVSNWMDDEDDVEEWSGFKTGLKPATEFAVLARKPMDGVTYENVLEHGTSALNIDGARSLVEGNSRYPANVCLDPTAARLVDGQSGVSTDNSGPTLNKDVDDDPEKLKVHEGYTRPNASSYTHQDEDSVRSYGDSGGASRFFYTAKPSPKEKTINGQVDNDHPTIKPLELMEWLVTLLTAPGQRVLDPFVGSGTTIMACKRLDRDGVGIDMDSEYVELAKQRVEKALELETDFGSGTPDEDKSEEDGAQSQLEKW